MTNEYERAMLEEMLEISANIDGCLIHDNPKGFNLSRKDRRKSQPKKPKGSKYFFKK